MNQKVLIIFVVILLIILGIPLLASLMNQYSVSTNPVAEEGKSQKTTAPQSSSSSPVSTPSAPVQTAPQVQYQTPPVIQQQPLDFTGTAWNVPTPYGIIQVSLNPGGQAIAAHPMVGTVSGTWRRQGNRIVVTASIMGKTQTVAADICGNTLCFNGRAIQRVK
ncbi:MAG TPA: hypothetical protein PLX23_08995 [Candidatus Hydrogenedens sp.]|nr:hypothetical protein [Candidatus Hydrogenedens sp.]